MNPQMIYLTQLIYIRSGMETVFDEFESKAIPLLQKHGGILHQRIRPRPEAKVEGSDELPYEIHIVSFPSEQEFENFMQDDERQRFVHLKETSVRSTVLVKGQVL